MFGRAQKNWESPESVINRWRAVGITAAGLDAYAIPDSTFLTTGVDNPRAFVPPQTPMEFSLTTSMGIKESHQG